MKLTHKLGNVSKGLETRLEVSSEQHILSDDTLVSVHAYRRKEAPPLFIVQMSCYACLVHPTTQILHLIHCNQNFVLIMDFYILIGYSVKGLHNNILKPGN